MDACQTAQVRQLPPIIFFTGAPLESNAVPNYVWRYRGRGETSFGPDSLRAWFDRAGVTHVVLTGPRSDAAPTLNRLLERTPGYLRLLRVWPGSVLAFAVNRASAGPGPSGAKTP